MLLLVEYGGRRLCIIIYVMIVGRYSSVIGTVEIVLSIAVDGVGNGGRIVAEICGKCG